MSADSPKANAIRRNWLCQFSYAVQHDDQPLSLRELTQALEENSVQIRDHVWTGWSMFYVFSRPEIAPRPMPENADGTGINLLQCDLSEGDTHLEDFWRVSPRGWASLLRPYREDGSAINDHFHRQQGTWIDPETIVRETAEFVRHGFLLAQRFPTARAVQFECTWRGLKGRSLIAIDPNLVPYQTGYTSTTDSRTTTGSWAPDLLVAKWADVVAALACPVLELFKFEGCGSMFVNHMSRRFIKLPKDVG